jgi:hypothetical protein
MSEPWYKSKTKVGGLLIGASMVIGAIGSWLTGALDANTALLKATEGLGVIAVVFGIRNALVK